MKKIFLLATVAFCNFLFTAQTCAQALIVNTQTNNRILQFAPNEQAAWLTSFWLENNTSDEIEIEEIRFYFAPYIGGQEVTPSTVGLFDHMANITICANQMCGIPLDTANLKYPQNYTIDEYETQNVSISANCDTGMYNLLMTSLMIAIEVDYQDGNGNSFTTPRISSSNMFVIKPLIIQKNGLNQTLPAVNTFDKVISRGVIVNESSVDVELKHMWINVQGSLSGISPELSFARLVSASGQTVATFSNVTPQSFFNFDLPNVYLASGDSFAFEIRADIINPQDGDFLFCGMQAEGLIVNFASLNGTWFNSMVQVNSFLTMFETPTGVNNVPDESHQITIYPNPTADFLHIGVMDACDVSVFDLSGALVLCSVLEKGANILNITTFPAGTYFVRAGKQTKQVVKL